MLPSTVSKKQAIPFMNSIFFLIAAALMKAARPRIRPIFAIFDPITFPMAMPPVPESEA